MLYHGCIMGIRETLEVLLTSGGQLHEVAPEAVSCRPMVGYMWHRLMSKEAVLSNTQGTVDVLLCVVVAMLLDSFSVARRLQ